MKLSEWDALSPRERDAIVAEKVMGKPLTSYCSTFACGRCDGEHRTVCGACGRSGHGNCYGDGSGPVDVRCAVVCEAPAFTTSWDAMREVESEMARRGFWLQLRGPFSPGLDYWAGFTPHDTTGWNGRPDHQGNAPTAPEAVALAALKALGHMEAE